jgi:uronate dehydrogenase
MLATWLSYDDLERLVVDCLSAPVVGHSIIYGTSDNQASWYDNTHARHIGFRPQDTSDIYRAAIEARQPVLDRHDPAVIYQGGGFVKATPHGQ